MNDTGEEKEQKSLTTKTAKKIVTKYDLRVSVFELFSLEGWQRMREYRKFIVVRNVTASSTGASTIS